MNLEQLRAALRSALDERAAHEARIDEVIAGVEARGEADLNPGEATEVAELRTAVAALDERRTALSERIAQMEERATARAAADALAASLPTPAVTTTVGGAVVRAEARTYSPETERRDGVSFFRDLLNRNIDQGAEDRIRRHHVEGAIEHRDHVIGAVERRDVGTAQFAGLTVPQYLVDLVAPLRRAMRPTADLGNQWELPPQGMTVELSRITTGSGVAVQAAQNDAVQETDMDDTALSVPVVTISGQQDVSLQAVRRSFGTDRIVMQDLIMAHDTQMGNQVINGAGTGGTHRGIRNTSGIVAVTYTDASPTAAETHPQLMNLVSQVQSGVFFGLSHFVMHPRRWNWLASQTGTAVPFYQQGNLPQGAGGQIVERRYGGIVGYTSAGVPVVVDGNIPTNLGVGTNQDEILGVTAEELHLWTDPEAPLFIEAPQVGAGNLTVKYVVYSFSAFTAGRYPGAHGTVGGTGLTAPVFA